MNEERLEHLVNEMYYNYLEQDEAEELIDYIKDLQQENQQLKDKYENIITRYRFIKNRVNQGMSIENKNNCLIELGNSILQELKGDNNE
jgi:hypothetical protein